MKYIKNFIVNLFVVTCVWIFLIHWFGFKVLLTVPIFWWNKLKDKIHKAYVNLKGRTRRLKDGGF